MDKGQGSRNQIAKIEEFKGYVTSVDSPAMGIDVAEEMINVAYDLDGGIRKREGIKQDYSFSNRSKEKMFFLKSRSTKTYLKTLEKEYFRDDKNTLISKNFIDRTSIKVISDTSNNNINTENLVDVFGNTYIIEEKDVPSSESILQNKTCKIIKNGNQVIFEKDFVVFEMYGKQNIYGLISDKNGNVYFSYGTILNIIKKTDSSTESFDLKKIITSAAINHNQEIIVGTNEGEVYSFSNRTFTKLYNINNSWIESIAVDKSNDIYCVAVDNTNNKKRVYLNADLDWPSNIGVQTTEITSNICIDEDGEWYVGLINGKILKSGSEINHSFHPLVTSETVKINHILFDKDNYIYVATSSNDKIPQKSIIWKSKISDLNFTEFYSSNYDVKYFSIYSYGSRNGNWDPLTMRYIELDNPKSLISYIKFNAGSTYPINTNVFKFYDENLNFKFSKQGDGSENVIVTSYDQELKTTVEDKYFNIKFITSDFFGENYFNSSEIKLMNYIWIGDAFGEVKQRSKNGEIDYKYGDYLLEISDESNNENKVIVSFYKLNGNTKTLIPFITKDGTNEGNYEIEKTNYGDYSIATVGDSTILSNGINIYSFIPIKNKGNNDVESEYIVAGTLDEFTEDVDYEEFVITGLNRLEKEPLLVVKDNNKLNGFDFSVKDIIITDGYTVVGDVDNRKLSIIKEPNKDHYAFSQISVPSSSDRDNISYEWKLFKLGNDQKWTELKNETNKVYISYPNNTSDINNKTDGTGNFAWTDTINNKASFIKINAFALDSNTSYQIQLKATLTSGSKVVSQNKIISFVSKNREISEKVTEVKSLWDEMKTCKYVANFDEKLVLYGNGTQQIYTSELGRPYFITAEEIVKADSFGKGEDIVSIQNFKDTKIIFTKSTMMSMTGSGNTIANDAYHVLPLDGAVGCVGHLAVTPIENTLAFVGKDGIYMIEQISVAEQRVQLAKISSQINKEALPYFDVVDKVDEELFSDIVATNLEQRLIISYPQKEYMLVFDYGTDGIEKGKWTKWQSKLLNPKDFIVKENVLYILDSNINTMVFTKQPKITNDIYDQEYPVGFFTDDGIEYEFKYVSKYSDLGLPYEAKKIKRIFTATDNKWDGNVSYDVKFLSDGYENINYHVDGNSYNRPLLKTGIQWGSLTTFRESHNIHSHIELISKPGRTIRMIITNDNDEPFALKGVQIEFTYSKAKGKQISK